MLKTKIAKSVKGIHDNKKVEIALANFLATKSKVDKLNEELKKQKDILAEFGKNELSDTEISTITFITETENLKITYGFDVKVSDEKQLRAILGKRFDDLVTTKEEFKPATKLREMALDDEKLLNCLSIKDKAPAFKVEA